MSTNRRTDGHSSCGKEYTFVMPVNFPVSLPLLILSAEVVWLPDRSHLSAVEGGGGTVREVKSSQSDWAAALYEFLKKALG